MRVYEQSCISSKVSEQVDGVANIRSLLRCSMVHHHSS